jgi:predicted ATPase
VLTTRKRCSTVSCTEGRRYAGGELPRNWVGTERARSSPRCPGAQRGHEQRNLCSGHWFEELTKTVVESGILVEAGDRYALTGPVAPLSIPSTLPASLLARLDRLPAAREVAQIGAALGRSFSHELISAVAQMPQEQLDDALAQLVSAGLIFRRGSVPDAAYTFKHALVQDSSHGTLSRNRRQQIHARIAATLESQFPEIVTAQPQVLAQHCAEANLNEKAVGYWLKAGQQAVARSVMTEAVIQLQKGSDLLASVPDGLRRREQELELLIALGQAQIATRGTRRRR